VKRINRPRDYRRPISIVCEGDLETFYFKALDAERKRRLDGGGNLHFKITRNGGKGPASNVQRAIDEVRRERNQVWCVMDVENPNSNALQTAIVRAEARGIRLALTNPSFDAWALAHLESIKNTKLKTAKDFKDELHERIGRPFSLKDGGTFASAILGNGLANLMTARNNIAVVCETTELLNRCPSTLNIDQLLQLFNADVTC
jgi:hypothetical protein